MRETAVLSFQIPRALVIDCCLTLQLRVTGSPRATTVSEGCSRITGADVEEQPGRKMDLETACGGGREEVEMGHNKKQEG